MLQNTSFMPLNLLNSLSSYLFLFFFKIEQEGFKFIKEEEKEDGRIIFNLLLQQSNSI